MHYSVWIQNLPLPPSVNEYLMPVQGRLVKTGIHIEYDKMFTMWTMRNKSYVDKLRTKVAELKQDCNFGLQVDMYFCFHQPRIYALNGDVKQLDRDNRIKPATDQMHKLIGIDDRYIFSGNSEKVTTNRKEDECLIVKISTMRPRSKEEILSLIKSETSPNASSNA